LQRVFGEVLEEERRRTKVIPRFMDENAALKLAYTTMIRAAERWCRVLISDMLLRAEFGLELPLSQHRQPQNQSTQEPSSMLSRPAIYSC
jgi:transposase-like protein